MDTKNLAELYELPALDWSSVTDRLDAGFDQTPGSGGPDQPTTWLTTIDGDGSPHVTAVGSIWVDGCFWFQTGPTTRKGRNLARDPRCSGAIATVGFDLVVEGNAEVVTDRDTVARLAARWAAGGWPCEVDSTGTALTASFSAPSAGKPPWSVYRVTARSAYAGRHGRAGRRHPLDLLSPARPPAVEPSASGPPCGPRMVPTWHGIRLGRRSP